MFFVYSRFCWFVFKSFSGCGWCCVLKVFPLFCWVWCLNVCFLFSFEKLFEDCVFFFVKTCLLNGHGDLLRPL